MAGLSPAGFEVPTFAEVRAQVVALWRDAFGDNAQTASDSIDGLLIDILSRNLTVAWEGVGDAYNSGYFQTAEGVSLDLVLAFLGLVRLDATSSTAALVLYGTSSTVVPSGALVTVEDTADAFAIDAAATIGSTGLVYAVTIEDAQVGETYTITIDGTNYDYVAGGPDTVEDIRDALEALVGADPNVSSAQSGGTNPAGYAVLVIDLSVVVVVTASATGTAQITDHDAARVDSTATQTGPIGGVAGTIEDIANPVGGWEGVTNPLDAVEGRNRETDAEFRDRARELLNGSGSASPDAIHDRVALLDGVTDVRVIENTSSTTDGDGRPPKSFEVVVLGGDDQEIAQTIWDHHAAGIETFGSTTIPVTDVEGTAHSVSFSRPVSLYVHAAITVTAGEGFPTTSTTAQLQQAIAEAVVAFGDGLGLGFDVYLAQVQAAAISAVSGISAVVVTLGTTPGPSDPTPPLSAADIPIDDTGEISRWDTARIGVTIV